MALPRMKATRAFVVLVIEARVHSSLDPEELPAFGSCRGAAFDSSSGPMPLPLPLPQLVQVRCHILVTCLPALHIEDNPLIGASGLSAVGIDNVSVLVMVG